MAITDLQKEYILQQHILLSNVPNKLRVIHTPPPSVLDVLRQRLSEINTMPCVFHRDLQPILAIFDQINTGLALVPDGDEKNAFIQTMNQSKNQCIQQARYVIPKAELTRILNRLIETDSAAVFYSSKRHRGINLRIAFVAAEGHFRENNVRITDYITYREGVKESIIMALEYKRWTNNTVSNSTFNLFKQALNAYAQGLGDVVESTERTRLARVAQEERARREEMRANLARHSATAATVVVFPFMGGIVLPPR